MSHGARSVHVCLKARYNSNLHNNGHLYVSQRIAAKEVGSGFHEIARWFRELQHYGFIVQTRAPALGVDGKGTAPHWRLTEVGYMKEAPSRDFARWNGERFRDAPRPRRKTESRYRNPQRGVTESCNIPALRNPATEDGTSVAESRNMYSDDVLQDSETYLVNHSVRSPSSTTVERSDGKNEHPKPDGEGHSSERSGSDD